MTESTEPKITCFDCGAPGRRAENNKSEGSHYECTKCKALWGRDATMLYAHPSAEIEALIESRAKAAATAPRVVDPNTKAAPALTAMDWQVIIQSVVGLVTMGVTRIEVHPARWQLIVDAALRFGGPMFFQAAEPDDDGRITRIPLGFMLGNKPVEALLMLWEPCAREGCEDCARIAAQGPNYPVPEEPSPVLGIGGRRFSGLS